MLEDSEVLFGLVSPVGVCILGVETTGVKLPEPQLGLVAWAFLSPLL